MKLDLGRNVGKNMAHEQELKLKADSANGLGSENPKKEEESLANLHSLFLECLTCDSLSSLWNVYHCSTSHKQHTSWNLTSKWRGNSIHFYGTAVRLTADRQKKKKKKKGKFPPSQKAGFLSYTHGSEGKCTRVKHHGRLKQEWSSFDDYLKTTYWYPKIPPVVQGLTHMR